ncbi:MAG: hypothetical protein ACYCUT_06535, partial [bacterium]
SLFYHSNSTGTSETGKKKNNTWNFLLYLIIFVIFIVPYLLISNLIFLTLPKILSINSNEYNLIYFISFPIILLLLSIVNIRRNKNDNRTKSQDELLILFILSIIIYVIIIFVIFCIIEHKTIEFYIELSPLLSILFLNLLMMRGLKTDKNRIKTILKIIISILTIISVGIIYILSFNPPFTTKSWMGQYQKFRSNILGAPFRILDEGGNSPTCLKLNYNYYKYLITKYDKIKKKRLETCKQEYQYEHHYSLYVSLILKTNHGYYVNLVYNNKNKKILIDKNPLFIKNKYVEQAYFDLKTK